MSDHDPSEFTHAYRVDTGERVYIPKSHLDVFKGSFRLSQRQQAASDDKADTKSTTTASKATENKEK